MQGTAADRTSKSLRVWIPRLALSRAGIAVIVAGLLVTAAVLAASALVLGRERQAVLEDWKVSLSQMSTLLAEHTRQSMTAADLVLKSISDRVNDSGIESDEELRREMGTREIFELLRNRAGTVPQVDVATIVAANGDVVNFTRSYPPPPINLADRDYFKAHMSDPSLDVILSTPVKNRGTGTWTFYLARKIKSRSGKTLGVVLCGIESNFFQEFFRAVNIGEASAISLFRQDGILLARFPDRDNLIGTSFQNQPVFRDIIGAGQNAGAVITSSPRLADSFTNQLRIVAPRTISGYPLVINITATDDLIFADWVTNARFFGGGAVLFSVLLLGLTAWIARLLTRREQTMRELSRARWEAENAAHAKSEFLAMMSHEIRTPMNAVIGTSSLLASSSLAPDQRRFVRIIEDSAAHLLAIINDILDFSRLEAGRLDIEKNLFAPAELAESAVELTRTLKGSERLDIATAIAGNLPKLLLGDAGRLNQVLLNLLSNAVKYTEKGSVTLSAAIVGQSDASVRVRFAVTDTGAGIDSDIQKRLFQPFEQGDNRLARRKGGTGLGLAISKRIVDLMGGRMGLESKPGHGSTFWFEVELDKAPPGSALQQEQPSATPSVKRSLNILVAEDTPANQVVARAMLEKLGHKVQVVSDGDEAVRAARMTGFDLILMDVQMPTVDGLTAAREIRASSYPSRAVPIIALTAFAQPADRDAARSAGMTDYLSKPIRLADLSAAIDRVVQPSVGARVEAPSEAGPGVIDEAALDDLRQAVGAESFARLITVFILDAEKALAEAKSAIAGKDSGLLKRAAHRLVGLFDQFGAHQAAGAAMAVETSSDQSDARLFDALLSEGRAAVEAIRQRHPPLPQ